MRKTKDLISFLKELDSYRLPEDIEVMDEIIDRLECLDILIDLFYSPTKEEDMKTEEIIKYLDDGVWIEYSIGYVDEIIRRLLEWEKYEGLKNNSHFQRVLREYFNDVLQKKGDGDEN